MSQREWSGVPRVCATIVAACRVCLPAPPLWLQRVRWMCMCLWAGLQSVQRACMGPVLSAACVNVHLSRVFIMSSLDVYLTVLLVFPALVSADLLLCHRELKAVHLRTLNQQRVQIGAQHFLERGHAPCLRAVSDRENVLLGNRDVAADQATCSAAAQNNEDDALRSLCRRHVAQHRAEPRDPPVTRAKKQ